MPATIFWDGGGSDNKWTNPQNWSTDVAPTPGVDDLSFPTGAKQTSNFNDFPAGTQFVAIQVEAAYTLSGNPVELTRSGGSGNAFTADLPTGTVTVNIQNLTFTGTNPIIRANQTASNLVFSNQSKITIGPAAGQLVLSSESTGANRIAIVAPITGPGDVVKIDSGNVFFQQTGPTLINSYTGTTFVQEGVLQLSGTGTNVVTIPGNVVIGDNNFSTPTATLLHTQSNQIVDSAIVTVLGDATYALGTLTERIGGLVLGSSVGGGDVTGTGKLELAGDLVTTGSPIDAAVVQPNITLINKNTTFQVPESLNNPSGPDLLITGVINSQTTTQNLIIDGGGRVELNRVNTGGFVTIVNDGVLILRRTSGTTSVLPGDVIIGDGIGGQGTAELQVQTSNSLADDAIVTIQADGLLSTPVPPTGSDRILAVQSTSPQAQIDIGNRFTLILGVSGNFTYAGSVTGAGRIQLLAPIGGAFPGTQTFSGPVTMNPNTLTTFALEAGGGSTLEVLAPVLGGAGGIRTTAGASSESVYLFSSTVQLLTAAGDFFYPGSVATPGPASTGKLDMSGTFVTRIVNPTTFGSLTVTGGNQTDISALGQLRVELPTNYRPNLGEVFKILDVVSPTIRLGINGITFFGLPEGARFFDTTGTVEFQISYAGGDGNDVIIVNTGAPSVTVRRAGDQPATTSATTAAFVAVFSAPVQPLVPQNVTITTSGTVAFDSVQVVQQNDRTFRITVTGLTGTGAIAASLGQGATFSLAGTPNQPSVSQNSENVVIVTTGGGGPAPTPPPTPGGTTGLGFFSGLPGPRTLVGAGVGGGGTVNVYQGSSTIPNGTFRMMSPSFSNGVRVATADFNFDGIQDYLLGSGPGSVTNVQLLDGRTGQVLFNIQPFESSFTGGVFVAAGDVNGDGRPDIAISPDEGGGPRVQIYSGAGFVKIADFFGIDDPGFRGGARPALGDLNGDGFADLAVAAGFGGGPRVAVYDGKALASGQIVKLTSDFFAFEPNLRNGTFVAITDINGDGNGDLVTGAGPGGAPRVTVYDGKALAAGGPVPGLVVVANFFAGPETNRGGVPLGVADFDADGTLDLVTGTGFGEGSRVRVYPVSTLSFANPPLIADFDAFPGFSGGVFVG